MRHLSRVYMRHAKMCSGLDLGSVLFCVHTSIATISIDAQGLKCESIVWSVNNAGCRSVHVLWTDKEVMPLIGFGEMRACENHVR